MSFAQTTSAILVFLSGLVPASCRKEPPKAPPVVVTNTVVVAKPDPHNLGQVLLTNHVETSLHLASGEDCLFTPKILDRQNVQISLAIESKNDYGETRHFAATQFIAESGKLLQIAVGDVKLTFTPVISTNE